MHVAKLALIGLILNGLECFGLQNDQLYPAQNVVFAMVFAAKFEPDPFHGKLPDF